MSTVENSKIWGKLCKTVDNYVDSVDKGHKSKCHLPQIYQGHFAISQESLENIDILAIEQNMPIFLRFSSIISRETLRLCVNH